jgi:serine/threonine protein phosphatase PrpC
LSDLNQETFQCLCLTAAGPRGQDRAGSFRKDGFALAIVVDGSGGTRGGTEAAERALHLFATSRLDPDATSMAAKIRELDEQLVNVGQCALVAVAIAGDRIIGASAGDCEAWLIGEDGPEPLTADQIRKPLIGSGAVPFTFAAALRSATLLLATDGLFKYAPRPAIAAAARLPDLSSAAESLLRLPRLRSGKLPDDVAVALCRAPFSRR